MVAGGLGSPGSVVVRDDGKKNGKEHLKGLGKESGRIFLSLDCADTELDIKGKSW